MFIADVDSMKPQHRNARKIFLSFDSNASYQLVPLFQAIENIFNDVDFICILKYCAIIIDNKKITLKIFISYFMSLRLMAQPTTLQEGE